jgi:hypothetical protein
MGTTDVQAPDPGSRQPLLSRAVIVAAVGAALGLAAAFGLDLSEPQREAITVVAVAGAPLVAAVWAHRHVWSGATVAAREAALVATQEPNPGDQP